MDKWRTPEAEQYRKLYQAKQWRVLREHVLLRDRFTCQRCKCFLKRGRSHPQSAVVHHIKAHKGDPDLFFDICNLQAVCWSCHSGVIQSEEARGYSTEIGADGWPTDPKHPIGAK
jgi:5-methylcytosine-specific restriction enzyme A